MSIVTDAPRFSGITRDMLTKILTGNRMARVKPPMLVSLNESKFNNYTGWLLEADYTLAFKYRVSIDQDILYNDPATEDMIKDQVVKSFNSALYGDIREDLNSVIDGLLNNNNIYDAIKALRKIIDKTVV